jgi:hypothetical protein
MPYGVSSLEKGNYLMTMSGTSRLGANPEPEDSVLIRDIPAVLSHENGSAENPKTFESTRSKRPMSSLHMGIGEGGKSFVCR